MLAFDVMLIGWRVAKLVWPEQSDGQGRNDDISTIIVSCAMALEIVRSLACWMRQYK